ncbi:MAG: diadenylate cyclase CdaA [Clostridia bacterium]|nr:diadenylate cyclase CdaA [Clostridia bacterium]MBP3554254.1 diadenylate cyclase CdaA [Clostridia bacterium]MBQ8420120.1 diadenylate cyclase CdaA [Clostridia bacterium]
MEKLFNNIKYLFQEFGFIDVLDILLVSVIIFYIVKFIRERRASKLAIGVVIVIGVLIVSEILEMRAMSFLLSNVVQVGLIALVILFQPELRAALEKVGSSSFKTFKNTISKDKEHAKGDNIANICQAVSELAREYTGALIIIERNTPLGDIIKTGTVINADICVEMLKNIFFNKAPMHDGAVVIHNNRIYAAGCFLPMSKNDDIIKDLGTRHRSAIGMSEESDAVVIVVSEETGTISIALNGELRRNYDYNSLKHELTSLLGAADSEDN